MIVVYLLVSQFAMGYPAFADMDSCERVRAAYSIHSGRSAACVQVKVPAPSREAHFYMPNKIGEAK
jgi:hypothetical protein